MSTIIQRIRAFLHDLATMEDRAQAILDRPYWSVENGHTIWLVPATQALEAWKRKRADTEQMVWLRDAWIQEQEALYLLTQLDSSIPLYTLPASPQPEYEICTFALPDWRKEATTHD